MVSQGMHIVTWDPSFALSLTPKDDDVIGYEIIVGCTLDDHLDGMNRSLINVKLNDAL